MPWAEHLPLPHKPATRILARDSEVDKTQAAFKELLSRRGVDKLRDREVS